jgi:hypothetical protein
VTLGVATGGAGASFLRQAKVELVTTVTAARASATVRTWGRRIIDNWAAVEVEAMVKDASDDYSLVAASRAIC